MQDQRALLTATLEANRASFDDRWKSTQHTEGWFNYPTALVWQYLLCIQDILNMRGNLVELGVWHGKSLTHSLAHCRPDERHLAIDIELRDGLKSTIANSTLQDRIVFRKGRSTQPGLDADAPGPYRWIHIDAGHDKHSVLDDLKLWAPRLSEGGILVMDDFFNHRWAEVTDATFEYLYAYDHNIAPLCIGANKAYFTTKAGHRLYRDFFRGKFISEYITKHTILDYFDLCIFNFECLCFRPPLSQQHISP